jgi:excisionase family DNA binding protein
MADERFVQPQLQELHRAKKALDYAVTFAHRWPQEEFNKLLLALSGAGGDSCAGGGICVSAEGLKEMGGRPKGSKDKGDPPKTTHSEAHVMTLREVCAYLQIHKSTLMRLIDAGKIPHFRMGSAYRFNRESIDEWMRSR